MPTAYSQVVQELISSLNDSCNICVSEIIFFVCLFLKLLKPHKNPRTSGMLGLICLYHNYKCLFTKHLVGAHKMRCSLSSHPC